MPDFPTGLELFEKGKKVITTNDPEISPDVVDRKGSEVNLLVAAAAGMGEAVGYQFVKAFQGLFVMTAHDDDLDLLAYELYNLTRNDEKASIGQLSFSRTDATSDISVPAGIRITTSGDVDTNVTVETLEPLIMAAGDYGPTTLAAIATTTGQKSNVQALRLLSFVTSKPDPTMNVTNLEPFAGGSDKETDNELRKRILTFWKNARRGTVDAIKSGALEVPGVNNVYVEEYLDSDGKETGVVNVVVADKDGNGNNAMVAAFPSALDEWKAAGVCVVASAGTPLLVNISVNPSYFAGVSTELKRQQIKYSIVAHVNSLQAGATLERSLIIKAVKAVPGVYLDESRDATPQLLEPSNDLIPQPSETIRTSISLIKVNGL